MRELKCNIFNGFAMLKDLKNRKAVKKKLFQFNIRINVAPNVFVLNAWYLM